MDLLIKNMEKPKKDDIVIMTLDSTGRVNVFGRRLLSLLSPHAEVHGLRVAKTDAIELPPHGDLIERDRAIDEMEYVSFDTAYNCELAQEVLRYDVPVFLEASNG